MVGLVDVSGDQSLYESEKEFEADRLDLLSTETCEAKRTCLQMLLVLVSENTSAR